MGGLYGDPCSFSVALFVFFKFAFWAVYTGTSVLSLLRYLFFLGRGVRFFSAFNAVLFCAFVVWRSMSAGLGLPSVGFVNAV